MRTQYWLTLSRHTVWLVCTLAGAIVLWGTWHLLTVKAPEKAQPPPSEQLHCGIPGEVKTTSYEYVVSSQLPWEHDPPSTLHELQQRHHAPELIAAFRTTLERPIFDEMHNVSVAAQYLAGSVVLSNEQLSLLNTIGPHTKERGYGDGPMYSAGEVIRSPGGGVCKVATTLYNVIVAADMQVVQRHPHSMQVPYVPPGRDAAIAWGYKDLIFRNTYDTPVVIWADTEDTTLYIALYGQHTPPRITWHHEELARQTMPVIRYESWKLDPGEEEVITEGFDGLTVRTWLTLQYEDGTEKERMIGVDTYRPMARVIQFGPPLT